MLLVILAVSFAIGCPVSWFLWFDTRYDERPARAAVAEADRLDPGWTLEELEAKRVVLPDGKNSATVVLNVKSLLPARRPTPRPAEDKRQDETASEESIMRLSPEARLTGEQAAYLRDELKKAEPALVEARKLVDLPQGRYVVSWGLNPATATLRCQEARASAGLLCLDATLRADDARLDEALASCRGVLNAGRSIGDEPNTISQLVAMSCEMVSIGRIERVIAQGQPGEQALEATHRLLEDEAAQQRVLFAMRGERAAAHRMMDAVSKGTLSLAQANGSTATGIGSRLEDWSSRRIMQHTHPAHLQLLTEVVEIAKLPPHEQASRLQKLKSSGSSLPIMTQLSMPALDKVFQACRRNQALLRAAVVALALERYRRKHDKWPEGLNTLVEAGMLRAIPSDPYDGKPLRYRRLAGGVVVYALGPDGNDDGGKLDRNNPTAPGSDLGIQLWDVPLRGAPARR